MNRRRSIHATFRPLEEVSDRLDSLPRLEPLSRERSSFLSFLDVNGQPGDTEDRPACVFLDQTPEWMFPVQQGKVSCLSFIIWTTPTLNSDSNLRMPSGIFGREVSNEEVLLPRNSSERGLSLSLSSLEREKRPYRL